MQVYTDNKGAHDLCHRFSSAQNSRHVDRKMFKMRELRGAGVVQVNYVPTAENPADLFTKILGRQVFEKHRGTVLNTNAAKLHPDGQVDDKSSSTNEVGHHVTKSDTSNKVSTSGEKATSDAG